MWIIGLRCQRWESWVYWPFSWTLFPLKQLSWLPTDSCSPLARSPKRIVSSHLRSTSAWIFHCWRECCLNCICFCSSLPRWKSPRLRQGYSVEAPWVWLHRFLWETIWSMQTLRLFCWSTWENLCWCACTILLSESTVQEAYKLSWLPPPFRVMTAQFLQKKTDSNQINLLRPSFLQQSVATGYVYPQSSQVSAQEDR